MNVVGMGLDLCPIDRMERAVKRYGEVFIGRIFTDSERDYCLGRARPAESLAARFAAKEAASKALGAPTGIGWKDVEVVAAVPGGSAPYIVLRGQALQTAESLGVTRVLLSMTHAAGVAAAVAVAVS